MKLGLVRILWVLSYEVNISDVVSFENVKGLSSMLQLTGAEKDPGNLCNIHLSNQHSVITEKTISVAKYFRSFFFGVVEGRRIGITRFRNNITEWGKY